MKVIHSNSNLNHKFNQDVSASFLQLYESVAVNAALSYNVRFRKAKFGLFREVVTNSYYC